MLGTIVIDVNWDSEAIDERDHRVNVGDPPDAHVFQIGYTRGLQSPGLGGFPNDGSGECLRIATMQLLSLL